MASYSVAHRKAWSNTDAYSRKQRVRSHEFRAFALRPIKTRAAGVLVGAASVRSRPRRTAGLPQLRPRVLIDWLLSEIDIA
jgi:hypothetical protein